ncbi:hypothetical protein ACFX11_034318 [Malus domestica]
MDATNTLGDYLPVGLDNNLFYQLSALHLLGLENFPILEEPTKDTHEQNLGNDSDRAPTEEMIRNNILDSSYYLGVPSSLADMLGLDRRGNLVLISEIGSVSPSIFITKMLRIILLIILPASYLLRG